MTLTASQLNTWMHERNADTVADLAQRGLAMEFIDAQAGRPTSLRLFSDKATFGFHLPLPEGFQGQADLASMMDSARAAALGFQQAFDGYERAYSDLKPEERRDFDFGTDTLEGRNGWQLHCRAPSRWREPWKPWSPTYLLDADLGDLMANWANENWMLRYVSDMNLACAVTDPKQSTPSLDTDMPRAWPASSCAFDIRPLACVNSSYRVWLLPELDSATGLPVIHTRIQIFHESVTQHFFGRSADFLVCGARFKKHPKFLTQLYFNNGYENSSQQGLTQRLKPEDLGMSNETAAMLISMKQPISAGLSRNITTESYDFDFSEVLDDDQVLGQSV